MIYGGSKIVFASLRASFVFVALVSVIFTAHAETLSPWSTVQPTTVSPGVTRHSLADLDPFNELVNRPVSTSALSATADEVLTVRAAAKVQTNYGPVAATAARKVSWSGLVSPWKKVLKAVPVIGTGFTIYEILSDLCIRQDGAGSFEQCVRSSNEAPPNETWRYTFAGTTRYSDLGTGVSLFKSAYSNLVTLPWNCGDVPGTDVTHQCTSGAYQFQIYKYYYCGSLPGVPPAERLGVKYCTVTETIGYEPVGDSVVNDKIDNYPSSKSDAHTKMPRLFDELSQLPKTLPPDHLTVSPGGATTISGDTSKPGPSTTETTADGQKVTTGGATVTYNGDTSTVVHNTTTTYINNAGDVINQTTTSEQKPSDCEVNPTAVACQELGDPGEGEIPRSDQNWSVTPESLPGGFCPAGFVFPIPGNPSFSWQPLCDNLPAVRAVIILLSAVAATWIVVGGLKS